MIIDDELWEFTPHSGGYRVRSNQKEYAVVFTLHGGDYRPYVFTVGVQTLFTPHSGGYRSVHDIII